MFSSGAWSPLPACTHGPETLEARTLATLDPAVPLPPKDQNQESAKSPERANWQPEECRPIRLQCRKLLSRDLW
ncbi:hypothetical protein H920_15667 [Fukomys damarensis]|uniref:Uncharacterized protein n=1 Tax=Fukomys damarensis TaxID=885580 RepID=A0A091CYG6_FUKDA|nr:hypothetical protein H920_15667 [Fukomys damarensis]